MGWLRLRTEKPSRSATINPPMAKLRVNPRTSKLKVALAEQALEYSDFNEFANAYWNECARGLYWYPTNDPNFTLGTKEDQLAKAEKFAVFCNPVLALSGRNQDKEYLAQINLTSVPRSKLKVVRGTQGAKIRVLDLKNSFVLRVVTADKSIRSWRYEQGLLPSSKDQLRLFWKDAHDVAESKRKKKEEALQRRIKRRAARDRRRSNPSDSLTVRKIPESINNPRF
jgi:hypothetical protein